MRFSTPFSKAATVCAAATLSLGLSVGTAYALPPGGASSNTSGTSSTVSPTVKSGGVISFNLRGFPANTMVSVKIDDGDACPADAPQGACVVHQQKSDGNGNVSGSFVLPSDLENGQHTLRFLATGAKKDSKGKYLGTEPFSNKSPVFTVTGGSDGGNKSGGGNSGGSSSESGSSNNNGGGSRSNGGSRSGGNKSGGGGASNNNGGGGSSNNDGGASGDGGSSNNGGGGTSGGGTSANGGGTADSGETEYVDADGNKITKEEYDRLNSENGGDSETEGDADTSNTEDGTTTNGEKKQKSSNGTTQKKATAKANASGVNKQSNSSDKAQAKNETTNTTITYGSEFPWIGTIVLAAAAIAAAIIVIVRRKA